MREEKRYGLKTISNALLLLSTVFDLIIIVLCIRYGVDAAGHMKLWVFAALWGNILFFLWIGLQFIANKLKD